MYRGCISIRLGPLSSSKKVIDNDDDVISLITNPFLLITSGSYGILTDIFGIFIY